jgi:hypothetical protein
MRRWAWIFRKASLLFAMSFPWERSNPRVAFLLKNWVRVRQGHRRKIRDLRILF